MNSAQILAGVCVLALWVCGSAVAAPTAQVMIPSTDIKGFKELALGLTYIGRFSPKADAGASSTDIGITTGLMPFENLKMEFGVD